MTSNSNPHDYPCICAELSSNKSNIKPDLTKSCWVCGKVYSFHPLCIQGWYKKMHQKRRSIMYGELEFQTKNTRLHRFYCPSCQTMECPTCYKKHNGGEERPILMFCRGDAQHDRHWFRSIATCFESRQKVPSVLDNNHWYCCASNTSPLDDLHFDYVSYDNAVLIMTELNKEVNFPENPFTHNGNGYQKFNEGYPYVYLNKILEMRYVDNQEDPILDSPATIDELNNIVKTTYIFIEAHRQLCQNGSNNQTLILENCFPGFGGITIDEVSSLLYSSGDSSSQPSHSHAISSSIIQLIAHSTNWFMESRIGSKWGIQSKCVCNTSGTFNMTDINPLLETDENSSRQYCTDMSNELIKTWGNHTMYTQQLHSFEWDAYILVRFLSTILDDVLLTSLSFTIYFFI